MTARIFKLFGIGFATAALLINQFLYAGTHDGLLAHYPLNVDAADASGNRHDGVIAEVMPTADRFGQSRKALLFDGTNSFVSVDDSRDLRLSGTDFTIAAWIFETDRNAHFNDCIISKRGAGAGRGIDGDGRGWIISVRGLWGEPKTTGRLFYQVSGGQDPKAFSKAILSLNQWHHIVVAYHRALAFVDMFIDGAWDSTTGGVPPPNSAITSRMLIGSDSQKAYHNAYVFHGKISDVRIYDRALAAPEVAGLYGTGLFLNGIQISGGALTRNYGGLTVGRTIITERSPDLLHWTSIDTNIVNSTTWSVTNSISPAINAEFFRVSEQ